MKIRKILLSLLLTASLLTVFVLPGLAAAKLYLLGDPDVNGAIEAADARKALRMSVGLDKYSRAEKRLADVDGDGDVSPGDARLILRTAVGLDLLYGASVAIPDTDFEETVFDPSHGNGETLEHYVPPMPAASTVPGTFTFTVYGYGHGVGFTQYGAVALDGMGYTYDRIVKHYFTGVEIVKDPSYGERTYYAGQYQNTEELVARIVYQEIYGITEGGKYIEACKAQAVCVYSLLKYYDFSVSSSGSVGYASYLSYSDLPLHLRTAIHSVIGEYAYDGKDPSRSAALTVYSAAAGGMTASSKDTWGGKVSYLEPVESSFDLYNKAAITTFTLSEATVRRLITNYLPGVVLSADPAGWLEITDHSASIDSSRGYVREIRVGNQYLSGYDEFCSGLMSSYFWDVSYFGGSSCFMIQYTP